MVGNRHSFEKYLRPSNWVHRFPQKQNGRWSFGMFCVFSPIAKPLHTWRIILCKLSGFHPPPLYFRLLVVEPPIWKILDLLVRLGIFPKFFGWKNILENTTEKCHLLGTKTNHSGYLVTSLQVTTPKAEFAPSTLPSSSLAPTSRQAEMTRNVQNEDSHGKIPQPFLVNTIKNGGWWMFFPWLTVRFPDTPESVKKHRKSKRIITKSWTKPPSKKKIFLQSGFVGLFFTKNNI